MNLWVLPRRASILTEYVDLALAERSQLFLLLYWTWFKQATDWLLLKIPILISPIKATTSIVIYISSLAYISKITAFYPLSRENYWETPKDSFSLDISILEELVALLSTVELGLPYVLLMACLRLTITPRVNSEISNP